MIKTIFRDMDLYKGIIFASLALLPAAGWWSWSLQRKIQAGQQAVREAEGRGGLLQRIGTLQTDVEEVQKNKAGGGGIGDFRTFIQKQIFLSSETPLSSDDFTISTEQDRKVSSLRAIDSEVTIEFKRDNKPLPLPRDYINALLYNFENTSKIWSLRHVRIRNEEVQARRTRSEPPPPELEDNWILERLVLARRSPDKRP